MKTDTDIRQTLAAAIEQAQIALRDYDEGNLHSAEGWAAEAYQSLMDAADAIQTHIDATGERVGVLAMRFDVDFVDDAAVALVDGRLN